MIPIIAKEWRRLLASPFLGWAILAYLLLPLGVIGLYLASLAGPFGVLPELIPRLGGEMLNLLAASQILLLAVGSPVAASGLIAGEEEEGTLQPLLATCSSIPALVAAKLTAVVGFMLAVVVAGLPLFVVPVMAGGVSWPLVGRAVLLEAATAVAMASVGLLLSALGSRSGPAAVVGALLGLAICLGGAVSFRHTPAPVDVYQSPELQRRAQLVEVQIRARLPAWAHVNPLVGLNSALALPPGREILGLPGAGLEPVFREYRLWQVQVAAAWLAGALAVPLASLVLWSRISWRWPVLWPPIKEGMGDGEAGERVRR